MYVTLFAIAESKEELMVLLEAGVRANLSWLVHNTQAPKLYASGVRYQREEMRRDGRGRLEEWLTIPYLLDRRHGDCEDLCMWLCAELRLAGERDARCEPQRQPSGGWHVVVRHANGAIEDPSSRLGMPHP